MYKFIVNTGPNKEVHRTVDTIGECNINLISTNNRLDTDKDYTVLFPTEYDGCEHCYEEKHWK
ncbi:hypothetical protein [Sporosarcina sp. E16_8]|uniref:hypothetical protein n=1 Tax=Sporosarcina sp. E16_8 TaxID=2789295 RepID=UPI001A91E62C|nr:hypothetical protein [Sporosarcina sp. E16_8]MBO0588410.1 hypothetical protein [Sporosarcina sp. E16_8]